MLKVNDSKIRFAKATGALLRPESHLLNKGKEKNFWVCSETIDLLRTAQVQRRCTLNHQRMTTPNQKGQ